MHKRVKLLQTLVIVFAVLFAVLLFAALFGRSQVESYVVINSDKIDVNKPLLEQQEFLTIQQMSKDEFEKFQGKVVTNYAQLKGAKLKTKITTGSPILVDLLTTTKLAGQFAYDTPIDHSVFLIPNGKSTLPPGVEVGDRISIKLIFEDDDNEKQETEQYIGQLVDDARIANINENNIWVFVSDHDFNKLAVSREFGSFVLTLPGVKEVGKCSDVHDQILLDKENEINELKDSEEFKAKSKDEQDEILNNIDQTYKLRILNAECVEESDKGRTINSLDIKEYIKENGEVISGDNVFSNTLDSAFSESNDFEESSSEESSEDSTDE